MKFRSRDNFFLILTTLCLQFTDLKVGPVKISELVLLLVLILNISSINKLPKVIWWFFIFFLALTVKTILQNFFTTFYIDTSYLPFIKLPGIISLSRFVEYLCCLYLCFYTYSYFKKFSLELRISKLVKIIEVQIFLFCTLFAIYFFYCYITHQSLTYDSPIVYNTKFGYADEGYRLKGFYIEGGPFGLFLSSLFIIYDNLKPNSRSGLFAKSFLLFEIAFLAQSKSGLSLILLWFGYKFITKIKVNAFLVRGIVSVLIIFVFAFLMLNLSKQYTDTLNPDNFTLIETGDIDGNVMAGKIPAMIIIPNMIKENLLFGIGLGNYPLLRNNPNYREFMPELPKGLWDAHGFGGFVDLLLDGGILFILAFILLVYKVYRSAEEVKENFNIVPYFIAYIGPMLFGVQMYFLYPWVILGFILANIYSYRYNG